jgi:photosystem II stability/assembly factor-like uncharacterized protein
MRQEDNGRLVNTKITACYCVTKILMGTNFIYICLNILLLIICSSLDSLAQDWKRQNSGTALKLNKIYFVDSNYGWAVGNKGIIASTINGGQDWMLNSNQDTTVWYESVYFKNTLQGWIVGLKSILSTTDGGKTWQTQFLYPLRPRLYKDLYFVNESVGYIVGGIGASGVIAKTVDSGKSWTTLIDTNNSAGYKSMHFINENEGWVVGFGGMDNFDPDRIIHTKDGGKTWENQISPKRWGLNTVTFYDNKIGWAAGASLTNQNIIKTTDGGLHWNLYGPDFSSFTTTMSRIDTSIFWLGGGEIYKSTNGFKSGHFETIEIPKHINCIYSICSKYAWACGDSGSIWRYDPLMTTINNENIFENKVNILYVRCDALKGSVQIVLELKTDCFLNFVIYNLCGARIVTFEGAIYHKGTNFIELDGFRYNPGIYFLIVRNENTQAIKTFCVY